MIVFGRAAGKTRSAGEFSRHAAHSVINRCQTDDTALAFLLKVPLSCCTVDDIIKVKSHQAQS